MKISRRYQEFKKQKPEKKEKEKTENDKGVKRFQKRNEIQRSEQWRSPPHSTKKK